MKRGQRTGRLSIVIARDNHRVMLAKRGERRSLPTRWIGVEPVTGLEPVTCGLRNRCSTTELHWHWRPRRAFSGRKVSEKARGASRFSPRSLRAAYHVTGQERSCHEHRVTSRLRAHGWHRPKEIRVRSRAGSPHSPIRREGQREYEPARRAQR